MHVTRAITCVVGNPWQNWLFVRLDTDQLFAPGWERGVGAQENAVDPVPADRPQHG